MSVEKTTRMNYLYDFYQVLLTDKQREYMSLYYSDDYSLGEIADSFDISRQAVYDNIKRTETMLEQYEEKLQLFARFLEREEAMKKLKDLLKAEALTNKEIQNTIEKLEQLH